MNYRLERAVAKIKSRPWLSAGIAAALLVILVLAFVLPNDEAATETVTTSKREVALLSVSEYQQGAIGLTAPTASGNSFVIRSEGSGKLVSVNRPGKVNQGAVIASFNNASERAALVQAEGVLDAARAAGAQGDIGAEDASAVLESAKQNAVNANSSAYTSFRSVLLNTVDQLFSNPRSNVPGVRLSGSGSATELNEARVALEVELKKWERELAETSANNSESVIKSRLNDATKRVNDLLRVTNTFITLIARQENNAIYTTSEITRLQGEFSAAAATLNSTSASLDAARTTLTRAEEGVRSASIGGTGSAVSSANAQIKQAQGAYMAALANYNKTIVRAPFAGTVTAINVKVGEILNYGADVAIITPNEGVETVSSFILPLAAVKYTPDGALVFIVNSDNKLESKSVETGLVTASSITVTGLNGDENIVNDVRGLKAGEEVAVK